MQSLGYTYDADDNVTAIADGVTSGNSQSFSYDVLNRLVGATGGYGTIAYTYDPVGNLVVRRTTNGSQSATEDFSYVANSNRLAWVSQDGNMYRQFLYTPTGNVAFDINGSNAAGLVYNNDNRLSAVTASNLYATSLGTLYTYDGFDRRTSTIDAPRWALPWIIPILLQPIPAAARSTLTRVSRRRRSTPKRVARAGVSTRSWFSRIRSVPVSCSAPSADGTSSISEKVTVGYSVTWKKSAERRW